MRTITVRHRCVRFQDGMGDEEDGDDPKAMQFAKMDVPEVYMATNDEELVLKLEQVGVMRSMPCD